MSTHPVAPVAFFVYNRVSTVARALECLRADPPQTLWVFADGSKEVADEESVRAVRELIHGVDWVEDLRVVERDRNLGVEESIKQGLDQVFSEHSQAVVIEDDVFVAPGFMRFLTECLEKYSDVASVAAATGLRYPFDSRAFDRYPFDAFFFRRFSAWGWGTWSRFWNELDFDRSSLVRRLERTRLQAWRAGADFPELIRDHLIEPDKLTWDVFVSANILLDNQMVVWPTWNMVLNGGFEGGTHFAQAPPWRLEWEEAPTLAEFRLPSNIREERSVIKHFLRFFNQHYLGSSSRWLGRLRRWASRTWLGRLRRWASRIWRSVGRPGSSRP